MKEFAGDNTELYAEEREQELKEAKAAERDRAIKIGGLLKPSDMDQEDELWCTDMDALLQHKKERKKRKGLSYGPQFMLAPLLYFIGSL